MHKKLKKTLSNYLFNINIKIPKQNEKFKFFN